ncbi:MAG: alpha-E domain-containing protein [Myxococcota bacterium]
MISRVAESCFWLNRYVERVEALARLLDVAQSFQLDVDLGGAERWRPLVIVAGQERDFAEKIPVEQRDDAETVQRYLCLEKSNPASILSSLFWARENARTIRETVSLEMWLTLNDLWLWFGSRSARRLWDVDRTAFYAHLRNQCALYHGHASATMLHEDPYEFMRLGTALERVSQTARLLDVKHHAMGPDSIGHETAAEAAQWLVVLRSCAAIEPFFKRPTNEISGRDVAGFLLFDPAFPRSVLHNLRHVRDLLRGLRSEARPEIAAASRKLVEDTLARFEGLGIEGVSEAGLHASLTFLVDRTIEIGAQIHADYFAPVTFARKVRDSGPEERSRGVPSARSPEERGPAA